MAHITTNKLKISGRVVVSCRYYSGRFSISAKLRYHVGLYLIVAASTDKGSVSESSSYRELA